MQDVLLTFDMDGMAGIVSALRAHHDVGLLSQDVNDFALAFIAPLVPGLLLPRSRIASGHGDRL